MALLINEQGELIVKAPLKLSNAQIFDFVREKHEWIVRQQQKVLQNSRLNHSVMSYNSFLFLGVQHAPVITDDVKKVTRYDNRLLIPSKFAEAGEITVLKKIEKWMRDMAKQIVSERCSYFGQRLRLEYRGVTVNNNKSRWGVCDDKGNIALNWRAVMLPPHLLDYIVVHEFCHLLEFNHTPQFWAIVETILPNWKVIRRELKLYNYLLTLFRPLPKP